MIRDFITGIHALLMYFYVFELGGPQISVRNNLVWSYCMKPQRTAIVSAVNALVLKGSADRHLTLYMDTYMDFIMY